MPIDRNTAAQLITDAYTRVWNRWRAYIPAAYDIHPAAYFVLHDTDAT